MGRRKKRQNFESATRKLNFLPSTPHNLLTDFTMAPATPQKKEKFKHSTPRRRNRIQSRYSTGQSVKGIAYIEGVDPDHVYGVVKRFRAQDYGVSRPGRGRPPKLDDRFKRRILREIALDPFIPITQLVKNCCDHVSDTTLRTYLKKEGIMHVKAATRPYLSEEHATGRYAFALEHRDKDVDFWRTVLFTDESTVERGQGAKSKWVFRPRGLYNTLHPGDRHNRDTDPFAPKLRQPRHRSSLRPTAHEKDPPQPDGLGRNPVRCQVRFGTVVWRPG